MLVNSHYRIVQFQTQTGIAPCCRTAAGRRCANASAWRGFLSRLKSGPGRPGGTAGPPDPGATDSVAEESRIMNDRMSNPRHTGEYLASRLRRRGALLFAVALFAVARAALCAERPDDFDAVVAPVIARNCLACHNPTDKKGGLDLSSAKTALAGGDSGPALVPDK